MRKTERSAIRLRPRTARQQEKQPDQDDEEISFPPVKTENDNPPGLRSVWANIGTNKSEGGKWKGLISWTPAKEEPADVAPEESEKSLLTSSFALSSLDVAGVTAAARPQRESAVVQMTVDFGDKAKEEPVQEKQKPTRQAHTPQPASQPVRQKKQIHETAKRQEKQKHETIKRQEEQNNKEKSIPEPHEFGQSFFKGGVSYSPRSNTEETEEQTAEVNDASELCVEVEGSWLGEGYLDSSGTAEKDGSLLYLPIRNGRGEVTLRLGPRGTPSPSGTPRVKDALGSHSPGCPPPGDNHKPPTSAALRRRQRAQRCLSESKDFHDSQITECTFRPKLLNKMTPHK
eukprot:GHVT01062671.1.p1 GENE.GHVT01062671.1~~GHVT01062671.1.p1  ORF type:complete len:344 (-),score=59.35 GHVT01062671.1:628-1659(-)